MTQTPKGTVDERGRPGWYHYNQSLVCPDVTLSFTVSANPTLMNWVTMSVACDLEIASVLDRVGVDQ